MTLFHTRMQARHMQTSDCVMRSIRDMLIDVRNATQALGNSETPAAVQQLRTHCEKAIAEFAQALYGAGFTSAAKDEAVQALSCFIDQEITHHLNAGARQLWDILSPEAAAVCPPLSSAEVLERARHQLELPHPDLPLLECYAAVLRLGLGRRTSAANAIGLQTLAASLNTVVNKLRVAAAQDEERASTSTRWVRRLEQSPSWLLVGVCSSLAFCVYRCTYLLMAHALLH